MNIEIFVILIIIIFADFTFKLLLDLAISKILPAAHFKMAILVIPVFLFAQFFGKRTFASINEIFFRKVLTVLLVVSELLSVF
jgi:hypothetical protein